MNAPLRTPSKAEVTATIDPYKYWNDALKGLFAEINADEPQTGFYRSRWKNKQTGAVKLEAVAYWYTGDGTLKCQRDGKDIDDTKARELWPYVARHPISHEVFTQVRRGLPWPGNNEVVERSNGAPDDDSIEAIQERIDDLVREAERLMQAGPATTQAACDQASDVGNTLGELQNKVIALHKVEKQPHLDAGRAVDTKWFSLRDKAADVKAKLKLLVVTPWLTKKADEANALKTAALTSGADLASVPETRVTAGSSKRSTGLRTYKSAKINDREKLLESLKEHTELNALLQTIADKAAKNDIALPGCEIVTERRAA